MLNYDDIAIDKRLSSDSSYAFFILHWPVFHFLINFEIPVPEKPLLLDMNIPVVSKSS